MQSGTSAPRRRLARKPKCRMRTKPRGSTCSKKRRKNSSTWQSQESFLVFVSGVSPAKRNLVIRERDEPVIGNCNPMSVGAEIAKYLFGSAERWLAIDNPAERRKADGSDFETVWAEPGREAGRGTVAVRKQWACWSPSMNLPRKTSLRTPSGERSGDFGDAPSACDPRKSAGGHDAVNVGMMLQLLIPGV